MAVVRGSRLVLTLVLAAAVLGGCGGSDAERLADDALSRAEELRQDARTLRTRAERHRDRLAERVRRTLDRLEKAIPSADRFTRGDPSVCRAFAGG